MREACARWAYPDKQAPSGSGPGLGQPNALLLPSGAGVECVEFGPGFRFVRVCRLGGLPGGASAGSRWVLRGVPLCRRAPPWPPGIR